MEAETGQVRPRTYRLITGMLLASLVVFAPGCAANQPSPVASPITASPVETTSPTPSATAEPDPSEATEDPLPKPKYTKGPFELPLVGSTGFASVDTTLKPVKQYKGGQLKAGDPYTILEDRGGQWVVKSGKKRGLVNASSQMINLPDLMPSIVYWDVNSDKSIFRSSGVSMPGITGEKLYESRAFNKKLQTDEYYMPVLYPMAAKIMAVQKAVRDEGDTLIMYQTFRPHDTQRAVGQSLIKLHSKNQKVRAGIDGSGWGISSFIALNLSNHQLGIAIDVSLGKIIESEEIEGSKYEYTLLTAKEYTMQTPMHELSRASSSFAYPVRTRTGTAWKSAPLNPDMTKASKRLRKHAIASGLTPISSEWWHFDDWDAAKQVPAGSDGRYRLKLPK